MSLLTILLAYLNKHKLQYSCLSNIGAVVLQVLSYSAYFHLSNITLLSPYELSLNYLLVFLRSHSTFVVVTFLHTTDPDSILTCFTSHYAK